MPQNLPELLQAAWRTQDYRQVIHLQTESTSAKLSSADRLAHLLMRGESHLHLEEALAARDTFLDCIVLLEKSGRNRRQPHLEYRALLGLIRANRLAGEAAKALVLLQRLRESVHPEDESERRELLVEEGWCRLAQGERIEQPMGVIDTDTSPSQLLAAEQLEFHLLESTRLRQMGRFEASLALLAPCRDSDAAHLLTRARLSHARGWLQQRLERNRAAVVNLESAITIFDRYQMYQRLIEVRALLARTLFQLGERSNAVRLLKSTRARAYQLNLGVETILEVAEDFNCDFSGTGPQLQHLANLQELPGLTPAIRGVNQRIHQIAASEIPVLILGETGVGKELTARAIHAQSERRRQQLVTIHCPSLSESLFESTLFGHRRGSFTGATTDREGLVEQAAGGTLFLDEISEIAPPIQAKLLRFLETREYHAVGSNRIVRADIRLLAASNRTYRELAVERRFRADLLHRIAGVVIEVPPLRERRDDIPLLLGTWLRELNQRHHHRKIIAPATIALLKSYTYPGNIRELRHLFWEAWELARSNILPEHISRQRFQATQTGSEAERFRIEPLRQVVSDFERDYLQRALQEVRFDKSHASRLLQISRQTLYTKLKQYGLLSR